MKSILAFLRKQAMGVLVLIAALYQIALGTSIEKKTINQIVVEADWLIHGTVVNLHEADDPNLKGLYTADLEVDEYLKGNRLDERLTVKWCGQVGIEHYLTDVLPKFEVGDTVIVALRRAEQVYYVVGAYQGAFRVKHGRIVGTTIREEEFLAQLRALVSHLKLNDQQPSLGLFKTEGQTGLLAACNPIDCSGYEGTLQQYQWLYYRTASKYVRWNDGNMNPTIYINMTNAKTKNDQGLIVNLTFAEAKTAIKNAFADWGAVSGSYLPVLADANFVQDNNKQPGTDNVSVIVWGIPPTQSWYFAETTYWNFDGSGYASSCDIIFNKDRFWNVGVNCNDELDLPTIARHEIGHFWGSGHTLQNTNNLMHPDFTPCQTKSIACGDRAGARFLNREVPAGTLAAEYCTAGCSPPPSQLYWCSSTSSFAPGPRAQIHVLGNVTVPSGLALNIGEGAIVKFSSGASLTINGTLTANGTSGQNIAFDRAGSGEWYGIVINSSSGSSSSIDYANIQHAIFGVQIIGASPIIKNSRLEYNQTGIDASYSDVNLYLENNTIRYNTGGLTDANGMYLYYSFPTLIHNLISRNTDTGVYGYYWASPEFGTSSQAGNNIVALNGMGLVASQNSYFQAGEYGVWPGYNSLYDNGYDAAAYFSSWILADQNWWGTPNQCGALYWDATSGVICNYPLSSDPNNWGIPIIVAPTPATLPIALGNALTKRGPGSATEMSAPTVPLDSLLQLGQLRKLNREGRFPNFIEYLQNLAIIQRSTALGRAAKGMLAVELFLAGRFPEALATAQELQMENPNNALEKVGMKTRFDVYLYGLEDSTSARNVLAELKTKYPDDPITKHARIALRDFVSLQGQESQPESKSPNSQISENSAMQPEEFKIYPNPLQASSFDSPTYLRFRLSEPHIVRLAIFNILGEMVAELMNRELASGEHVVRWGGTGKNGQLLPSGLYFARLQVGSQVKVGRLLVLR